MSNRNATSEVHASGIVGFVDAVNESGIYGWAYSKHQPEQPVLAHFVIDGAFISKVHCNHARPDVLASGHPTQLAGFEVEIPEAYCDNRAHQYWFTTPAGEKICLDAFSDSAKVERSFCFDFYFDWDFYTNFYPAVAGADRQAAYHHWAKTGRALNWHANPKSLLENLDPKRKSSPGYFSPRLYRFLNLDGLGREGFDWELELHYIEARNSANRAGQPAASSENGLAAAPARVAADGKSLESGALGDTLYQYFRYVMQKNGIVSDQFLKFLNVADYAALQPALNLATRLECALHFVQAGIQQCAPLSFEHRFDAGFVAEYDASYAGLDREAAYLRWINQGIENAVPPNAGSFLKRLGLSKLAEYPDDFDADRYLIRNRDLGGRVPSRWAALEHFVEVGVLEGKSGGPSGLENIEILRVAADRCAIKNDFKTAKKLYERLLDQAPADMWGLRHYGDCLLRSGEHFQAAAIYHQTIALGKENVWTYINLAACHEVFGRLEEAGQTLLAALTKYPDERIVEQRLKETLQAAFEKLSQESLWLARHGYDEDARRVMERACRLLAAPFRLLPERPAAPARQTKRLAIVADMEIPQCKFYRVEQKTEQLNKLGIENMVYDYRTDIDQFVRQIPWLDAAIFYRVPAHPAVMDAIFRARRAGIQTYFELDDLLFDPALFPDRFESYGGQIDHALYATLIIAPALLRAAMEVCDYAIASTPALALRMKPIVAQKKAFVHRNALSRMPAAGPRAKNPGPDEKPVRIFYGSGTKAHNEDFNAALAAPLAGLFKKWQRKLELVVMGYLTLPEALEPFAACIRVIPPNWDRSAYLRILREMDINIAVLKPGPVSDCKSEIKWLEAAVFSIPSVVSATATFGECIAQNKTGILIEHPSEWFAALDGLIADAGRRQDIGGAANAAAQSKYGGNAGELSIGRILGIASKPPVRRKRRLLITHVFFYPQIIGGATRVVMDNIRDIRHSYGDEFEIEVFTTFEGTGAAYVATSYFWESLRVTAVSTVAKAGLDQVAWDEEMAALFAKTVERFQPDLIHFHCIQRLTASLCGVAKTARIPYFITVHDGWWISETIFLVDDFGNLDCYDYKDPLREVKGGDASRLQNMEIKRQYLNGAERVLMVSEPFAELYRQCGFTQVVTVANGVSNLQLAPRTASPHGKVRLTHVGGTERQKGFHVICAAFAENVFENLSLLVIDHAMDPQEVRYATWGRTQVQFRGKCPQAEVGQLYAQTDVLLAPSVWPESFGLVTREAALAGCWVIASNRGAVGLDVSPENGFIIDVASSQALAGVLRTIDQNPEKYLASPASRPALRSAAAQADELVALYRSELSARSRHV